MPPQRANPSTRRANANASGPPGWGAISKERPPMRRKSTKIVVAIAAIAAIVAGGAAFTASNTVPASIAGYATSSISGATATALTYTLSADGTQITGASLTFTGDQTGRRIAAGFGTDDLNVCTVGAFAAGKTSVTCTGFGQNTAASATFNVAVS